MLIFFDAVIDDKTCEERLWNMKHRGETNFYLCEINRDMVIDATYKGNKSRYINHSCCPNTEMQKWFSTHSFSLLVFHFAHGKIQHVKLFLNRIIDGETRIGIFATRDIKKGEHLTYDYQYEDFHYALVLYQEHPVFLCYFVRMVLNFLDSCSILICLAGLSSLVQIKIVTVAL